MTSDDYTKAKALQLGNEAGRGRCCVFQRFDKGPYDRRYEETIAPAVRAAGLEPYRVDQDDSAVIPVETLHEQIRSAVLCLADISNLNPNVMYEIGYAIANDKDVVIVCSNQVSQYPFNIRHRNVISYAQDSESDFKQLKANITKKIKALLKRPNATHSRNVNTVLHSLTRPELAITWESEQKPFHHEFKLTEGGPDNILFRVKIHNNSLDTSACGVQVYMEDLEPPHLSCVPTCMKLMNDNETPSKDRFDLAPDQYRFVDVIQHNRPNSECFLIWHITRGISLAVPSQPYRFTIKAYAENTPSASQRFEIYKDGRVEWKMRAIAASASSGQ
jgi:hypothetical protein